MELYENEAKPQRALLVCVDTGDYDAQSSLDELWELAESAGAVPVATLTQKKEKPVLPLEEQAFFFERGEAISAWGRRSGPSDSPGSPGKTLRF